MDYGLFTMPSHPPERSLYDGHQWDLQQLRWADELGFSEAWIGEHHTAPWEPHPSPDLLVAQALLQTERMRIGPGGFLMPYHHPAPADRRGRGQQGPRPPEARRRARLLADEPQPEPRLRRQPLGVRGAWRGAHRPDAEARGLASRARGLHRRHRRGGDATLGRRHDGPDDAGVLPAAPRVLSVHRVPEAPARRARLRRHPRVLRQAQLAGGLAGHGDRAAPRDLRGGRRLRHAAAVLLRLRGQPQGVAPLDGAAGARGHAALQEPAAEVSATRVVVFLCAVMAMGAIPDARGQTPASPPVEGSIYSVTYVEVMPPSATAALAVLKRYREAASREDGNLRSELAQRIGEPHEFVVLAVWRDRAAFAAHAKRTSSTDMRERIAAIRNAPTDKLAPATGALYDTRKYKAVD